MATIKEAFTDVSDKGDQSALSVVWTPVTESDTCRAYKAAGYTPRSIHVSGTFGSSTTTLGGSNTGTNFLGLKDLGGSAISITSEALKSVLESAIYYQPSMTGGTGQSLTVTMLFNRAPTPRS